MPLMIPGKLQVPIHEESAMLAVNDREVSVHVQPLFSGVCWKPRCVAVIDFCCPVFSDPGAVLLVFEPVRPGVGQ